MGPHQWISLGASHRLNPALTIMTTSNETDILAPSATITVGHTNQIGALQAVVACDTNITLAKRNLFFVL